MTQPINADHFGNFDPPSRYRLLSANALLAMPKMPWVVQDVLPKAGVAAIYGDSKNGKSFLAIDLLMAIDEGREWFGYKTEKCPVTYLALEAQAGVGQRLLAYSVRQGAPSDSFKVVTQDFALVNANDVIELAACLMQSGQQDGVVIIDTLSRAAVGLDENSSRDMGLIIDSANKLQKMVGGLVVLVHHTGKDGNKGPRGHSSLMASLDAAIRVDKKGKRRIWTVDKAKDAEDGRNHDFELEIVNLGVDQHDNPTSSCVVVPVGGPRFVITSDQMPRGAVQEFVWKTIKTEQERSQDFGKGGAPEGMPCVHLTRLVELGRKQLTKIGQLRVRERVKNAADGLLERGVIKGGDGWYWFPKFPENP